MCEPQIVPCGRGTPTFFEFPAHPFAFILCFFFAEGEKKARRTAGRAVATPHCYNLVFSSSSFCLSPAAAPRVAGRVTPLPDPQARHRGGWLATGLISLQIRH